MLHIHGNLYDNSVKRLCFCHTPKNLYLNFTEDLIPKRENKIQRVDFSNLTGPVDLNRAFSLNFNGDIFMRDLAFLREIRSHEFGRGANIPYENLEGVSAYNKFIKHSKKYRIFITH